VLRGGSSIWVDYMCLDRVIFVLFCCLCSTLLLGKRWTGRI
jgi:hypothetical protein